MQESALICSRPGLAFSASSEALAAANIHPATGLATDYLNHFNEVTMLIEISGSMPEVIEDIVGWEPRSYPDHFGHSGFRHKDLAIATWHELPRDARDLFEEAVAALDEAILDARATLLDAEPSMLGIVAPGIAAMIRRPMAKVQGLINGLELDSDLFAPESTQGTIDHLMR